MKDIISRYGAFNFTEKENLLAYPGDTSCQYYDVHVSELEACLALNSNNTLAACIQELKSEENLKYCTRSGFEIELTVEFGAYKNAFEPKKVTSSMI